MPKSFQYIYVGDTIKLSNVSTEPNSSMINEAEEYIDAPQPFVNITRTTLEEDVSVNEYFGLEEELADEIRELFTSTNVKLAGDVPEGASSSVYENTILKGCTLYSGYEKTVYITDVGRVTVEVGFIIPKTADSTDIPVLIAFEEEFDSQFFSLLIDVMLHFMSLILGDNYKFEPVETSIQNNRLIFNEIKKTVDWKHYVTVGVASVFLGLIAYDVFTD